MVVGCLKNRNVIEGEIHQHHFPEVILPPVEIREARQELQAGIRILRYGSNNKPKHKTLYLDNSMIKLIYTPSRKPVWKTTIYLKNVVEIREAEIVTNAANMCVCMIYLDPQSKKHKVLRLVCPSAETKKKITNVISFLANKKRRRYTKDPETTRMLDLWMEADINNDGRLSKNEVSVLLQRLNVQLTKTALSEKFKQADTDSSRYLNFKEFQSFYKLLHQREEVSSLFPKHGTMTLEDFKLFCQNKQEERLDGEEAERLLSSFGDPEKGLLQAEFTSLLFSKQNSWWKPGDRENVTHDMDRPLNQYFISSSHNTYLTGNQFQSKSSCDAYRQALEKGCRCVELDCWDGPNGDPEIFHGYTVTSRIKFRAVCETIFQYAFRKSEYPVLLSLEVHTCEKQQVRMAEHMREAFGEALLTDAEYTEELFTPNALKRRILVKGKLCSRKPDGESDEEHQAGEDDLKTTNKVALELSELVTLRAAHPRDWGMDASPNYIQSLSESSCEHYIDNDQAKFVELNKRMMTRIYPSGKRLGSTNYDPCPAWSVGCQCVALNFQTMDTNQRLNETRFESNGCCGYILKPSHLIGQGGLNDYSQPTYKLIITIKSGCQIPKPPGKDQVDPYVICYINGTKEDQSRGKHRTEVVDNNGFNPVWNKTVSFTIKCMELAILTLRVMHTDLKVAEAMIPLPSLRRGYRSVPLRNPANRVELEHSCLLVKTSLRPE